jgi:hypothetical protein
MKSALRPNLGLQCVGCIVLAGIISAEALCFVLTKRGAEKWVLAGERTTANVRALGPLAATSEELAACEASFGDSFHVGGGAGINSLSGRTRMTVELSRVLAASGLEEKEASASAARLVRSPEATLAATCIAKSEGLHLRKITEGREGTERFWILDASCAADKLPELLTTLGENTSGMSLTSLDVRAATGETVELRVELTEPLPREDVP